MSRAHLPTASIALMVMLANNSAQAADITVTDAKIAGGKLLITGTTAAPGSWVRLDGQTDQSFNVKSDAAGAFAFGIVYHPGDCIVDLQRLLSPTALGPATSAVVANCGPGVTPRGPWNARSRYVQNDLVVYEGSTWRAQRSSTNTPPRAGAVWELFAAAGEAQADGQAGAAEAGAVGARAAIPAAEVTPTGPAGGDLTGSYPNPLIGNLRVTTAKIADNAIVSAKIPNYAINANDLAPNAVTPSKILNNAITGPKVADNSLTGADINEGSLNLGAFFAASEGFSGCTADDHALNTCASASLTTERSGRILVIATGSWNTFRLDDVSGVGSNTDNTTTAYGTCQVFVDGVAASAEQPMGEHQQAGLEANHPGVGPNGTMALTGLSDVVAAGSHTVTVGCTEVDGDLDWAGVNLTALLAD